MMDANNIPVAKRETRFSVVEQSGWIEPRTQFPVFAARSFCVWLDTATAPPGYSILAAEPTQILRSKGDLVEIISPEGVARLRGNPFDVLKEQLTAHQHAAAADFPVGAAIGYFGYDLKNFVEKLPANARNDMGLPDCWFGFYDNLLVFDHAEKRVWRVTAVRRRSSDPAAASDRQVSNPSRGDLRSGTCAGSGDPRTIECQAAPTLHAPRFSALHSALCSDFTRDSYCRTVLRAKEYIAAGDIYQVNLSQRFQCSVDGSPVDVYLALRTANPAPYCAYLDIGEAQILSSSPECFLNIRDRHVVTRPIKGTRPRGKSPEEDKRIAAELLASPKDNAELVMITDLERNDLGRVCEFGSVRVNELVRVETYATVHHLVATVEGRLRRDMSHVECVRACFPGGSITGAPKIRAMQIIDELEPYARGVYTGAIGFLGFNGVSHFNIVIRTAVYQPIGSVGAASPPRPEWPEPTQSIVAGTPLPRKGCAGRLTFHAGGGIVADSEPDAEYDETLAKAQGILNAIEQLRLR
jgi:para-aminobenzoate synthetase component I